MKNILIKIFKKFKFLPLIVLLISCDSVEPEIITDGGIRLVDNLTKSDWSNDEFDFNSVNVIGDSFVANVSYGGGCEDHEFVLVISTGFEKSNPVQTSTLLSHNNNDDMCEAYITKELKYNLKPLRDVYVSRYGSPGTVILKLSGYHINVIYSFN